MANHPETVLRYPGTLDELATDVGDLRYDALVVFLQSLAAKLASDAQADEGRGRKKLAKLLRLSSEKVSGTVAEIDRAWKISAPHMPQNKGFGDDLSETKPTKEPR
ncbi:MAG: hypothetical protein ACFCD0_30140 [Gemmataceae bacterium]